MSLRFITCSSSTATTSSSSSKQAKIQILRLYKMSVQAKDLSYFVLDENGKKKCILNSVSCEFVLGTVTAIMGPSGAG